MPYLQPPYTLPPTPIYPTLSPSLLCNHLFFCFRWRKFGPNTTASSPSPPPEQDNNLFYFFLELNEVEWVFSQCSESGWMSGRINEWMIKLMKMSKLLNVWVNYWAIECLHEWESRMSEIVYEWMSEQMNGRMSEWMNEWVDDWGNAYMSNWMDEWMNE